MRKNNWADISNKSGAEIKKKTGLYRSNKTSFALAFINFALESGVFRFLLGLLQNTSYEILWVIWQANYY